MTTLSAPHRNILERTVKSARDIAEEAARAALERMTVSRARPADYLTGVHAQGHDLVRGFGNRDREPDRVFSGIRVQGQVEVSGCLSVTSKLPASGY